ncbi:hypothetical protein PVAP13_5NG110900 [Panicum virgatum]|uniref:Methyltransferase n=1 Tax=Panicum virgatum TaxID=38727 RepID=A0A8T0S9T8_PANVG|nr:hypothetical protein PVAP13_5NG110900 [Panicum virgatum]
MGIMEGYPRKPSTQHQSHMDALPAGASSSSATHAPPAPHHATAKKRHYSDRTKILLIFLLTNSVSILLSVSFSHVTGVGSGGLRARLRARRPVLQPKPRRRPPPPRRGHRRDHQEAHLQLRQDEAGRAPAQADAGGAHARARPAHAPVRLHPEPRLRQAVPGGRRDVPPPPRRAQEVHEVQREYVTGECPSGEALAESLMLRGCEPLPRRRCRARGPAGFPDPTSFPESLWAIPPDKSVSWGPYMCKNYSCLVDRVRRGHPGSHDDCEACFDLAGKELRRWVGDGGGDLDYDIDTVLASKPRGTIRIGLDIGGGTGTFAARMAERSVTVVTEPSVTGPV